MLIKLRSFSNPHVFYKVDTEKGICSCPAFVKKGRCKHVEEIGVYIPKRWSQSTHPTFAQALSGLVKAIRIRSAPVAVYWLVYLESLKNKQQGARFRVARRILIGASEDGMDIQTMEEVAKNFPTLTKSSTSILHLAADVVRICKTLNWWHADSGGHEYIRSALIGYRQREFGFACHGLSIKEVLQGVEDAVKDGDSMKAHAFIDAVYASGDSIKKGDVADFLMDMAKKSNNKNAQRVLSIPVRFKRELSFDANFIGQGLYWLLGKEFKQEPEPVKVTKSEVESLIIQAQRMWQNPGPIPAWCCDGIHCGGTDRRFAGMLNDMDALCQAYTHYGKIDPRLPWLRSFYTLEGLIWEEL